MTRRFYEVSIFVHEALEQEWCNARGEIFRMRAFVSSAEKARLRPFLLIIMVTAAAAARFRFGLRLLDCTRSI